MKPPDEAYRLANELEEKEARGELFESLYRMSNLPA